MTGAENFMKNFKCKHGPRSATSNSAWCDLNKSCTVLKLHYMFHNPKCTCQEQITFTPKQFQLEGSGFGNTMKEIFSGNEKRWNFFIKPRLKIATPMIWASVAVKTKNLQSAQITSNNLKSITGGKILSFTDLHGDGLRLRVVNNRFK